MPVRPEQSAAQNAFTPLDLPRSKYGFRSLGVRPIRSFAHSIPAGSRPVLRGLDRWVDCAKGDIATPDPLHLKALAIRAGRGDEQWQDPPATTAGTQPR